MTSIALVEEYMGPLLAGNRTACRKFVLGQLEKTPDPSNLYHELIWPAMERVEKLYRGDRINIASEHMATRINRAPNPSPALSACGGTAPHLILR